MNARILISACALPLLLSSCVTSTLTAAAAAAGGNVGIGSLGDLLSSGAPKAEDIAGMSLQLKGEQRGADNVAQEVDECITFGKDNPTLRVADGVTLTTFYSRKGDKKALVTVTGRGTETYRLNFTSGSEGSYSYERRNGADFATGEGSFTLK